MVLGLVQAAHENTLHNKSVSLRLLHDLLPNFSRSQEVRSAPASTQSMVHRMRTVEHASPLHTVGAEESSVQVRRPNNFVEPSNEPRTACTSASDSLSISAACVLGGSPRFFSLRDLPRGRQRMGGRAARPREVCSTARVSNGAPSQMPPLRHTPLEREGDGRHDGLWGISAARTKDAQKNKWHACHGSCRERERERRRRGEEPGRSHHRATAGAPLRARLGRLLAAGARRAGLRHVVAAVLVMSCLMTGASCSVKLFWAHVS
ncbi:unnamed protein product [Prorocentrum cordatum]|uniref:Uncharacterized protein n=1 Tax=Prorocentrum cordatum TaxID=2364126 RepID=A0ABN9Y1E9_9DINO|nr:unnamed protein product [Polarella glacialis]